MCEHGINAAQMRLSLAHCEEALAMVQQWLEQLHHLADHASMSDSSVEIAQVTVLLGEARSKLERAAEALDTTGSSDVTVELV